MIKNFNENLQRRIENYLLYCNEKEKDTILNAVNLQDFESLEKWFSVDLSFGTGGLRGKMGIGFSNINEVTILKAAHATINFFKDISNRDKKSICISYDTRKNSSLFAKISAIVAAKNGFYVYLAPMPLPSPFLSYIIPVTESICGIMITASHNPKEYNGFKVYDETGCQILEEKQNKIMKIYSAAKYIEKVDLEDFNTLINSNKIEFISEELINKFVEDLCNITFYKNIKMNIRLLNIVYTSLHGTGINIFRILGKKIGFNVSYVESQIVEDPNFSNVKSLNPENKESLIEAIELGINKNADLIVATDPDADRLALAFKSKNGYFIPDGNEIGVMLFYYICTQLRLKEIEHSRHTRFDYYAITTIVTTDLLEIIGKYFGIEIIKTLTGFKYIGNQINLHPDKKFLFAAEESYGYLYFDRLRDKDSFSTIVLALELTSYLKSNNLTAEEYLQSIYHQFGYYCNEVIYIDLLNDEPEIGIEKLMNNLRDNPPESIENRKIRKILDFKNGYDNLPKSDIIQYFGENFKITIRPSGTEPKLKIYVQVVSQNKKESKELLETFKNFFIYQIKLMQ
ncbi:MAG: phospho-sugar mutase [Exilispira sp.]